jgi:hypothetical protein
VADGPGEAVQNGLGVFVAVGVAVGAVGMGDAVGVHIFVIVLMIVMFGHLCFTSFPFYPKPCRFSMPGLKAVVKLKIISCWNPPGGVLQMRARGV